MRKLFVTLLFSAICTYTAFAGSMGVKDSIGTTIINDKVYVKHMVTPGETVYGLSTRYRVSITDMMETNPDLENGLKVGQILNVPYDPKLKSALANEDNKLYHIIEPGETMFSLARKYGVTVTDLMRMNNMELKAGQKLVVGFKDSSAIAPAVAKTETKPATVTETKKTEPIVAQETKTIEAPVVVKEVKKEEPVVTKEEPVQTNTSAVVKNEPLKKEVKVEAKSVVLPNNGIDYTNVVEKILVIPFDPYLYFSDADDEIAAVSKMQRPKVRQAFRKRLNAMLEPEGYETIHLLGGRVKDSLTDLNKIYSSVTYSYQDQLYNKDSEYYKKNFLDENGQVKKPKTEKKLFGIDPFASNRATLAKDEGKYFGVKIVDPEFFSYFNHKYKIDYYVFVNQFEVKTNYDHCLDRAAQNYERSFITHYSIFDKTGKQLSGNRMKLDYNSNSNSINRILTDNMQKIANRIVSELPARKK